MVETCWNDQELTARIVLRPNRSLSWSANLKVLGFLAILSLTIATVFLLQGLWLILPFTALELLLVLICFFLLGRANERQEVLTLSAHEVCLERGRRRAEERHIYNRQWTRFVVHNKGGQPILHLQAAGEQLRIGEFLNEQDLRDLIKGLRQVIAQLG